MSDGAGSWRLSLVARATFALLVLASLCGCASPEPAPPSRSCPLGTPATEVPQEPGVLGSFRIGTARFEVRFLQGFYDRIRIDIEPRAFPSEGETSFVELDRVLNHLDGYLVMNSGESKRGEDRSAGRHGSGPTLGWVHDDVDFDFPHVEDTGELASAIVFADGEAHTFQFGRLRHASASNLAVGTVVAVSDERLRLSDMSGERDFFLPGGGDSRRPVLLAAFRKLSKGDRVALELRAEGARAIVVNLVGGRARD